jgi:ribosomal protein L7Ae-like RNA K-turn-binding protein
MNNKKILSYISMAQRARKLISGTDMIIDTIRKDNKGIIIVAEDASKNTKKTLKDKASTYNTKVLEVFTIEELSNAIGKENRVAVYLQDEGFKNAIIKNIE